MKNSENEIHYSEFEQGPDKHWVFTYQQKSRLELLVDKVQRLRHELKLSRELSLDLYNKVQKLKAKRKKAKK